MGAWLLGGVAAVYVAVSLDYWRLGRYGMMLAFVGYALANLGFIWDLRR